MHPITAEDPAWIGPYRLLGRLGAGGMGRVYLARSEGGRTVAVKLVLRELARDDEFRRRFAQEVAAARRVGGQWTAPVLDADTDADVPWVATGYVPGPSLTEVVDRDHGPLPDTSVRALASGLSQALASIHAVGLVHRDLKPSNILVTVDGPRVIDFGIARALDGRSAAADVRTRTGVMVGSPGFMSPEQVRGESVTAASDVFCLGAVLAYAATGRTPFGGADSGVHTVLYRIAQEEPDLEGVPSKVAGLVRACLIKDPAGRPTVAELVDATRDAEPAGAWLPGALLAQLGQRAARLLDTEAPQADRRAPQPHTPQPHTPHVPGPRAPHTAVPDASPALAATHGPSPYGPTALSTPPTPPPGPYGPVQHSPYGPRPVHNAPHPQTYAPLPPPAPARGGGRTALIVTCSVLGGILLVPVILIIIGILVDKDDKAETPEIRKIEGAVPDQYLGSWEGVIRTASGERVHGRFEIRQGERNMPVAKVRLTRPRALCEGESPLRTVDDEKITLGAGTRTRAVPKGTEDCAPPPPLTLAARTDGKLDWRMDGAKAVLEPSTTQRTAVHPKYLGTWQLGAARADDRLRITIEQGDVGKQVATATGAGRHKDCTWVSVLAGAHNDRLVLSPLEPSTSSCPVRGRMVITPAGEGKLYVTRGDETGGGALEELTRVEP
ncbi:serine/threonine-protein kinase [Streptomyces sp. NPDC050585]|uniref:serine/threonine-protein kinase n=1 Tax=Streptomyces sp. NPDC050585 TaxID=3365632 RepID=UPI0037B13A76